MPITTVDQAKSTFLTEDELTTKMVNIDHSFTHAERLEEEFIDLKGFLIATRDGHRYRFDADTAIVRLLAISKKVEKLSLQALHS